METSLENLYVDTRAERVKQNSFGMVRRKIHDHNNTLGSLTNGTVYSFSVPFHFTEFKSLLKTYLLKLVFNSLVNFLRFSEFSCNAPLIILR